MYTRKLSTNHSGCPRVLMRVVQWSCSMAASCNMSVSAGLLTSSILVFVSTVRLRSWTGG